MPLCPHCRGSYESWVIACPDCDQPLGASLPFYDAATGDAPLVPIASFASEPLARMWAEALERHGVTAVLQTAGINIGGVLSAPVGDYRLLVRRAQVRRARRLLSAVPDPHPLDYDYRI